MGYVNFNIEEPKGDFNLKIEALENILFSACVERMKLAVEGVVLLDTEVDEIITVKELLEDMKRAARESA